MVALYVGAVILLFVSVLRIVGTFMYAEESSVHTSMYTPYHGFVALLGSQIAWACFLAGDRLIATWPSGDVPASLCRALGLWISLVGLAAAAFLPKALAEGWSIAAPNSTWHGVETLALAGFLCTPGLYLLLPAGLNAKTGEDRSAPVTLTGIDDLLTKLAVRLAPLQWGCAALYLLAVIFSSMERESGSGLWLSVFKASSVPNELVIDAIAVYPLAIYLLALFLRATSGALNRLTEGVVKKFAGE